MPITLKDDLPFGFDQPTKLPSGNEERLQWQQANSAWWEQHPMRYDSKERINASVWSEGFFAEIDRRFFEAARVFIPWRRAPFDSLIDFDSLGGKDVLEIGVGCGSHAALLARHAASFVGIDLTDYAVRTTSQRLKTFGLKGRILRMDAEMLQFEDEGFDFIWTWGVIHHSADTRQVLEEMRRVLRPGGTAMTMVYHRGFWNYYFCNGFVLGVLGRDLFRTRSLHKTVQTHTDGAMARYFSAREWKKLASDCGFRVQATHVYGAKPELIPLPGSRLKAEVLKMIPDSVSRLFTNQLRMGSFLVSQLTKE
jgi:ubiquinone/menaquinone biosynthesis C-methylase UbiE